MAVSIVLMLVTPPLCRRYGAPAAIVGLTLSALLFAVGGTWATPNLSPLTVLLTMVPLLVGFAYLGRRWIQVLSVVAVAGSAGVAALGEWRRTEAVSEEWWVNAVVIAVSLPAGVLVVVFLVRRAYARLQGQSAELVESRRRVVEVADAARRSLERDLHDGAQQRLLASSVTIERARKELKAGRHESAADPARPARRRQPGDRHRAARAGPRHLPAAAHRARARRRPAVDGTALGGAGDAGRRRRRADGPAGRGGGLLLHPRGADQRRQALRGHRGARHPARSPAPVVHRQSTTAAGSTATRWTPGGSWGWRRGSPRPAARSPSTTSPGRGTVLRGEFAP